MQRRLWWSLFLSLALSAAIPQAFASTVHGELYKWHPVEIDFVGPLASEDGQGSGRSHIWRARFSADEVDQWRFSGLLRSESEVASLSAKPAGVPTNWWHASAIFRL